MSVILAYVFVGICSVIVTLIGIKYLRMVMNEESNCNHDYYLFLGKLDDDYYAVRCLKCGNVKEVKNK
jgi:hypothetical protein